MSGRYNKFVSQDGNPLQNVLAYYETLSDSVGFTVTPYTDLRRNSACYRVMAYRLRDNKRFKESEQIYLRWIQDAPNAAKPYAGLAQTYAAMGEFDKALRYGEKSVELAKRNRSPSLVYYHEKLEELRQSSVSTMTDNDGQ